MISSYDNAILCIALASFDLVSGVKVTADWIFTSDGTIPVPLEDLFKMSLANVHRQSEDLLNQSCSYTSYAEICSLNLFVLTNIFVIPRKPYNVYYGLSMVIDSNILGGSANLTSSLSSRCAYLSSVAKYFIQKGNDHNSTSTPVQITGQQNTNNINSAIPTKINLQSPKKPSTFNSVILESLPANLQTPLPSILSETPINHSDPDFRESGSLQFSFSSPIKRILDKYVKKVRFECENYISSHITTIQDLNPSPSDTIFLSLVLSSHLQTQMTTCLICSPNTTDSDIDDILNPNRASPRGNQMKHNPWIGRSQSSTKDISIKISAAQQETKSLCSFLSHFMLDYQLYHSSDQIKSKPIPGLFIQCLNHEEIDKIGIIEIMLQFETPTTFVILPSRIIISTPSPEKQKIANEEYKQSMLLDDINRKKRLTHLVSQYTKQIKIINHSAPLASAIISLIMQGSITSSNIIAKQQMDSIIRLSFTLISLIDEYIFKKSNLNSSQEINDMALAMVQQTPKISGNSFFRTQKVLQRSNSFSFTAIPNDKIIEIVKELNLTGIEDFNLILSVAQLFDKIILKKVYGNKY